MLKINYRKDGFSPLLTKEWELGQVPPEFEPTDRIQDVVATGAEQNVVRCVMGVVTPFSRTVVYPAAFAALIAFNLKGTIDRMMEGDGSLFQFFYESATRKKLRAAGLPVPGEEPNAPPDSGRGYN